MNNDGASHSPTAGSLMRTNVSPLRRKHSLLDAVVLALRDSARNIPIVDKEGRLVGVLSDADLRNAVGDLGASVERRRQRRRMGHVKIRDMISREPAVVGPDATLGEMAAALVDRGGGALMVIDADSMLLGVVSDTDLLRQMMGPATGRRRERLDGMDGAGRARLD